MRASRVVGWSLGLALAALSPATILHVPQDYSTIQMALDSVGNGDTVLVEPAVYAEALQARPGSHFVMLGEMSPDSQIPVVDPSPLDSSQHLACLTLPSGCSAVIRSFGFRNGPQMYPRNPPSSVGGIINYAASLTLDNCVFDSTFKGVNCYAGLTGILSVSNCRFILNQMGCILDRSASSKIISHCDFSAYYGRALWLQDDALLDHCNFHDMHEAGDWMWLEGHGIVIRECMFGPTLAPEADIIWSSSASGWRVEGNVFHDLEVLNGAIAFYGIPGDTSYFLDNVFARTYGTGAQSAGGGLDLSGQDSAFWPRVVVRDNIFDSCFAATQVSWGSLGSGRTNTIIDHNLFSGPDIGRPNVNVFRSWRDSLAFDSVEMHFCSFVQTGWALRCDAGIVDAQFNWWGDASGPHHSLLNPEGLGDSITGRVHFGPWLLEDPLNSREPCNPLPASAQLEVYPNPFNSTTTLTFTLPRPAHVQLDLFDVLGRKVRTLVNESRIAGEYRIPINAADLPSGIYLARLRAGNEMKAEKLLLLR